MIHKVEGNADIVFSLTVLILTLEIKAEAGFESLVKEDAMFITRTHGGIGAVMRLFIDTWR